MIFEKLQIQNKTDFDFFEELYLNSFPIDERRPISKMIDLIKKENSFDVFIVSNKEKQKVGFITQWNLETVLFIEHFAISPDFRNGGYGKIVLQALVNNTNLPIVGEIELPEVSEMAARRKSFYEKAGFKIWDVEYEQPPLANGQNAIPMLLITYGDINSYSELDKVKNNLYTNVYFIDSK